MSKNPLFIPVVVLGIVVIVLGVFLVRSGASDKGRGAGENTPMLSMQDLGKGIDGVRIQIKVKKTIGNSEFTDSLYYTPEEWATVSKEDVEKSVQQRIDNWTKTVTTASAPDSAPTSASAIEPAPNAGQTAAPEKTPASSEFGQGTVPEHSTVKAPVPDGVTLPAGTVPVSEAK
jgi:hypothetical protein